MKTVIKKSELTDLLADDPNSYNLGVNDLGRQYNGKNNGDLCATWSMMAKRGWSSRSTTI